MHTYIIKTFIGIYFIVILVHGYEQDKVHVQCVDWG